MEPEIQPQKLNLLPQDNKKRMMVVIGMIAIVVIVIGGYFIFSKRLVKPSETQTQQSLQMIDISDWKTYTNNQYGFELKYPSNWVIENTVDVEPNIREEKGFFDGLGGNVRLTIYKNPNNLSAKDWYQQTLVGYEFSSEAGSPKYDGKLDKIESVQNGIRVITPRPNYINNRVFIKTGNSIIRIGTNYSESDSSKESRILLFDKILSTFKFVNSGSKIDTSNWKTYVNSQYGFEIEYPKDWILYEGGSHDPVFSLSAPKQGTQDYTLMDLIRTKPKNLSLKEYVSQTVDNSNKGEVGGISYKKEFSTIIGNDIPAYELYNVFDYDQSSEYIYILKNGLIHRFSFPIPDDNPNILNPKQNNDIAHQILSTLKFRHLDIKIDTSNWKTYTNTKLGYEFKYPSKLKLIETNSITTLSHSIDYKNYGPCDMSGDENVYDKFTDFEVSFEMTSKAPNLTYNDGEYKKGALTGLMVYEGIEGCGNVKYYFTLPNKNYLIITEAAVQALGGNVNSSVRDEILNEPGVISAEEESKIFDEILSSFKFTR